MNNDWHVINIEYVENNRYENMEAYLLTGTTFAFEIKVMTRTNTLLLENMLYEKGEEEDKRFELTLMGFCSDTPLSKEEWVHHITTRFEEGTLTKYDDSFAWKKYHGLDLFKRNTSVGPYLIANFEEKQEVITEVEKLKALIYQDHKELLTSVATH